MQVSSGQCSRSRKVVDNTLETILMLPQLRCLAGGRSGPLCTPALLHSANWPCLPTLHEGSSLAIDWVLVCCFRRFKIELLCILENSLLWSREGTNECDATASQDIRQNIWSCSLHLIKCQVFSDLVYGLCEHLNVIQVSSSTLWNIVLLALLGLQKKKAILISVKKCFVLTEVSALTCCTI